MWLKFVVYLSVFCTCCNSDKITENLRNNSTIKKLHIGFLWPKVMVGHSVPVALNIGLEMAKQNLPGYQIDYTMKDSKCSPKIGIKAVLHLRKKYPNLDAIIGTQCSSVCQPVGLLAAVWNIPQVSSRCSSMLLSNKTVYSTFSRTRGSNLHTSRILVSVLQTFGWQRYSIVSSDVPVFKYIAEHVTKFSKKHNMDVQLYKFSTTGFGKKINTKQLDILRSLILAMKKTSRVTLLFMYHRDLRNFLILAKQYGFLGKDYVFIGLDAGYGWVPAMGSIAFERTDSEVYQGVIAVTEDDPQVTEQWEKISNETWSYYLQHNVSKQETETALNKDKPISGKKRNLCLNMTWR